MAARAPVRMNRVLGVAALAVGLVASPHLAVATVAPMPGAGQPDLAIAQAGPLPALPWQNLAWRLARESSGELNPILPVDGWNGPIQATR
jgi:hypothetical protein